MPGFQIESAGPSRKRAERCILRPPKMEADCVLERSKTGYRRPARQFAFSGAHSLAAHSAIDHQHRARCEAALAGGQIEHRTRDLVRRSVAAEWNHLVEEPRGVAADDLANLIFHRGWKLLSTGPGWMVLTRIRRGASSLARQRINPTCACLAAI